MHGTLYMPNHTNLTHAHIYTIHPTHTQSLYYTSQTKAGGHNAYCNFSRVNDIEVVTLITYIGHCITVYTHSDTVTGIHTQIFRFCAIDVSQLWLREYVNTEEKAEYTRGYDSSLGNLYTRVIPSAHMACNPN